jgi:hypothetical protein
MRLPEDATAVYSRALYRKFVQPVDRALASRFPCGFMHLHSISMFLLDAFFSARVASLTVCVAAIAFTTVLAAL